MWKNLRRLEPLKPQFVSVTYGAGGSTRDRTHKLVKQIKHKTNIEPAAHLTCMGSSVDEIENIENTLQIQGDFTSLETQNQIKDYLKKKPEVVMSDMAVNTTGIKNIDSIQTGELCKEAMVFSKDVISEKGYFISKIFMGSTFNEIVALGKKIFKEVKVFKPKSSRKDSKESFIICKNLR